MGGTGDTIDLSGNGTNGSEIPASNKEDATASIEGIKYKMKHEKIVDKNGNKNWCKLHRLDGPAVEKACGTEEWWVDGKRHRTDGAAVVKANGTEEWWVNGKQHRTDGPAYDKANGTKEWWVDGKLHREDGPAYIKVNCPEEWWVDGKFLGNGAVGRRAHEKIMDQRRKKGDK